MKNLLFAFFLASFLPILTAANAPFLDAEKYCNARFDYCMTYPTDNFATPKTSVNGDGFQVISNDGEVYLSVAGSFNVMDWTLEDIFYFNHEDFKQQAVTPTLVESTFEQDYSIHVFKTETEYIFFKTMLLDDKYVTITISAPLAMQERVETLRDAVSLTTNA